MRRSPRALSTWDCTRNRVIPEVGAGEVRVAEVGAGEVGQREIGAAEVGGDQVGATEVGAAEVHGAEVRPDEVGPSPIERRARGGGAREPARSSQQGVDRLPMGRHVERFQHSGVTTGEALGLLAGRPELGRSGLVAASSSASARYQSSSWSCRTIAKAAISLGAMAGSPHQSAPAATVRDTRCPAPKQS